MLEFLFEGLVYVIFELAGNIAVSYFIPESRSQLHMDKLKDESWFKELDQESAPAPRLPALSAFSALNLLNFQ